VKFYNSRVVPGDLAAFYMCEWHCANQLSDPARPRAVDIGILEIDRRLTPAVLLVMGTVRLGGT